MVNVSTERAPARSVEPTPDTASGLAESRFSATIDRSETLRSMRPAREAPAVAPVPAAVAQALREENARFIDHCNNPETSGLKTPLSPKVQQFVRDNPLSAHHFVAPKDQAHGFAFAGKLEYERAQELIGKMNSSAEKMLDLHAKGAPYKEIAKEQKRFMRSAGEYATLTGDRECLVMKGHTSFSNQENRQKWATEMARLQTTVEQAAHKAQEKQLAFIQKNNLGEDKSWMDGIKLDKLATARYSNAIKGFAPDGKAVAGTGKDDARRPERFVSITGDSSRTEGDKPGTPASGELAKQLLKVAAAAESTAITDTVRSRELQRVSRELLDNATPTERGLAIRELSLGLKKDPGNAAQYREALSRIRGASGNVAAEIPDTIPDDAPAVAAATPIPVPGLRTQTTEALHEKAKANVQAIADAIVAGKPAESVIVEAKTYSRNLSPLEQKEYAEGLKAALEANPMTSTVERNLRSQSFKKPLGEGEASPQELCKLATKSMDTFTSQFDHYVVNPNVERTITTEQINAKAQENAQKLVIAAAAGRAQLATALLSAQTFDDKMQPVERKEYAQAMKTILSTMDFEAGVGKIISAGEMKTPTVAGGSSREIQAKTAQKSLELFIGKQETDLSGVAQSLNPDSAATKLWTGTFEARNKDSHERAGIIAENLESQFTRKGLNTPEQVEKLRLELRESIGLQIEKSELAKNNRFDKATRDAYHQLDSALTSYKQELEGDAAAMKALKATFMEMNRERVEGRAPAAPGDLITRAFAGREKPGFDALRRYNVRLGWLLENEETPVSAGSRKLVNTMRQEITKGELAQLAI